MAKKSVYRTGGPAVVDFNMTPMIDVTFQLILFFILVGQVASDALAQMPIGRAIDRHGGRVAITVCSAAFALSVAAVGLPTAWWQLVLAFAALRALGVGALQLACSTCLQQWFIRRRGLATGMAEAANALVGFGVM